MGWMENTQPQQASLFPRIFRFITERAIFFVVGLASLFVLGAVIFQTLKVQESMRQAEFAKAERLQLSKELAYWQGVVRQYGNYRDAYFKIATLQYQLGEVQQAKKSLEKVLALDPNFEKARVLGDKISAE